MVAFNEFGCARIVADADFDANGALFFVELPMIYKMDI